MSFVMGRVETRGLGQEGVRNKVGGICLVTCRLRQGFDGCSVLLSINIAVGQGWNGED